MEKKKSFANLQILQGLFTNKNCLGVSVALAYALCGSPSPVSLNSELH